MSVEALQMSSATAQQGVQTPRATRDVAAARKAAEDFEAVFINEFLGSMFEGLDTNGPFGGGPGEGMFRSMMLDEYAKTLAHQGGFGLASSVMRELTMMQSEPAQVQQ